MGNNKIFITILFLVGISAGLSYTFANNSSLFDRGYNFSGATLTEEQKLKAEEFKTIFDKQKNGESLTEEEQAKLGEVKGIKPFGENRGQGFNAFGGKNGEGKANFTTLTEEEKEARKASIEEQKVKFQAKEAVIDKLLNLQALTAEEELIRQEIVKERAEKTTRFKEKE